MKRKIITFFSLLLISAVSIGSVATFAYEDTNTSSTFTYSLATSVVTVKLNNGKVTVGPSSSTYGENYKNITAISYIYNSSTKEYNEKEYIYDSGNKLAYTKTLSTSNVDLIRGVGQIGNSQSASAGIKGTVVANSKRYSDYPTPEVYN